jgi:ATP/maltotriose-dependent transcriptional regulator MalT
MVDVFVSYSREDHDRVTPIVAAMGERGWQVWWDERLKPGPRFDEEIEKALDAAKVVVVMWSKASVVSDWVKTEASAALERDVLLPATLEEVRLPLAFRRQQCIDLAPWQDCGDVAPLENLLDSIEDRLGIEDDDFVGRADELANLHGAIDRAIQGSGQLCLISGEPGIGKTRLLQQLEASLEPQQASLYWAFTYEDAGLPPYFAWTSVLRECLTDLHGEVADELLTSWGGQLGRLLPELGSPGPASGAGKELAEASDQARMQLFVAVSQCLFAAARQKPLVLFFDNAHLLDRASLKLLEFFAQQIQTRSIAIVLTYRDTDVDRKHPLFYSLANLSQQPRVVRVSLGGLRALEVALLCSRAEGGDVDPGVAAQIQERAEGNPLFVTELLRMPSQDFALQGRIPDRIREVIAERLHRLPDEIDEVLGVAAVVGRNFTAHQIVPLLKMQKVEPVLDLLDLASRTGFVESTHRSANRYRFRHELIRQCLYDEHGSARRVALHRDLARQLEASTKELSDERVALLAHHLYEAGVGGDLEQATHYCLLAGQRALRTFAFAEAGAQFGRALELMDLDDKTDGARRAEVLLEHGKAEWAAGNLKLARRSLLSASIMAARSQNPTLLALSIIQFNDFCGNSGKSHRVCLPLHKLALQNIGDDQPALRARLLASYALLLVFEARVDEAEQIAEQCLAAVQLLDEYEARLDVLKNVGLVFEYYQPKRALELCKERYALACDRGDTLDRLDGLFGVLWMAAWRGELPLILSLIGEFRRLAVEVSHFHYLYLHQGTKTALALLEGRWTDAVASAREQYLLGNESGARGVDGTYAYQMFTVHWMRGKLDVVAPMLHGMSGSDDRTWQPGYALICAELDMREDARDAFEKVAHNHFAKLPKYSDRSLSLAFLAETCVYLRDRERAAVLAELLRPFADQNIGFVHSVMIGSGARYLAKLELLLGNRERALDLFKSAIEMNAAMNAEPVLTWTQFEYAQALVTAKRVDNERVLELLDAAADAAERLDMASLSARIEGVREPLREGAERLSNREVEVLQLVAEGASNREIADRLFVSTTTVATHMRNIMRKTEAANRVEAVATARRTGWLSARN